ncbi:hypothetical protein ACFLZM_00810 [Thermodesulfobacteriota bacterium]
MQKTVPLKREERQTVRHELTADELVLRSKKVLELKEKAMKENVHYGIIPGMKKPSLWKPGAEKLCQAFRLEPQFETTSTDDPNRTIKWEKLDYDKKKKLEGTTQGYIEYDSRCALIHIPNGETWASNVSGSCNNFEAKYRSLNPYDVKNTLEKMSEKRSLVAAVLIGTAASDIFTQDLEDMGYLNGQNNGDNKGKNGTGKKRNDKAPAEKSSDNIRTATDKQVSYIKGQLKKRGISGQSFFEEWKDYCDSWDNIPFNIVNDILDWIRGE